MITIDKDSEIVIPDNFDNVLPLEESDVVFKKGEARALLDADRARDYYAAVDFSVKSRDFDVALDERIVKALEAGHIESRAAGSRFEDGKWRVDTVEVVDGKAVFGIAPTHFREFKDTDLKAYKDPDFRAELAETGTRIWSNPLAYFANPISASMVLKSSDGDIVIGQRADDVELMPGFYHCPGGYFDAIFSMMDLDGSLSKELAEAKRNTNFYKAIQTRAETEVKEEFKVFPSELRDTVLLGFCRDPLSQEFNYAASSILSTEEILARYAQAEDKDEHKALKAFSSTGELVDFLRNPDIDVVPVGRAGLLMYIATQDAEAAKYALKRE